MRNHIRPATLVAVLALMSSAPSALAAQNTGGASVGGSTSKVAKQSQTEAPAAAPGAAADPIVVKAVPLTRSQTKSVQRRVKVKPDGALGSKTRVAIKKYQTVQSLTPTGRPNIETLRAMKLKIADKLEAKLRAEESGAAAPEVAANEEVALQAPAGSALAALEAARTAIGTPYRSGGTTTAGFDCSGLTQWAFGKAGIKLPRTSFQQYGVGTAVEKADIQAGDLVFFDSNGGGASHVGIAASATTVISATTRGVMEHDISAGYWASHYVGARRVAGEAVKASAASVR